jgi:hypothetical protein
VTYDLTLPLTVLGAVGGVVLGAVAAVVLLAALVRAFAPDSDALGGDETPAETLIAYGRAVVVAVLGTVAAAVGLAALVVPGLVVLVHLPLVFVAVATDGVSVGRAVDRTWTRVRGHRARVVAVALAVVVVPLSFATIATLTELLPPLAELLLGALLTTVAAAVGAAAFTAIGASLDGGAADAARTDRVTPTTSRQL